MQVLTLFSGVTTNTTPPDVEIDTGNVPSRPARCYQATVTGTGAVTATITFFGSVDGINYPATPFATVTLSGATAVTDNFASAAAWPHIKCTTASVTGTEATVSAQVAL